MSFRDSQGMILVVIVSARVQSIPRIPRLNQNELATNVMSFRTQYCVFQTTERATFEHHPCTSVLRDD